jgi:hypothetical protein
MSARNAPIEWVGEVAVYAPTSKGYYRLKWDEPDGRPGDTSGGRTIEDARYKAAEIDARLAMAAGPSAVTTLGEMYQLYVAEATSPFGLKPWSRSYKLQVEDNLARCLRGFEHARAMNVDRKLIDQMRVQAGTTNMVTIRTRTLRGFLRWGHQHEAQFFTAAQAELLPTNAPKLRPQIKGTAAPSRRSGNRVRDVGQSEAYIQEEDAPSPIQVTSLGTELGGIVPAWGELSAHLAANSGPRWGEQFQLRADDVHPDGCPEQKWFHIHVDWQIDPGGKAGDEAGRRCPPKGRKARIIGVPPTPCTDYDLRGELVKRCAAAREEQAAGSNPEALLFPAPMGGLWWYSSFESNILIPAMRVAGVAVARVDRDP